MKREEIGGDLVGRLFEPRKEGVDRGQNIGNQLLNDRLFNFPVFAGRGGAYSQLHLIEPAFEIQEVVLHIRQDDLISGQDGVDFLPLLDKIGEISLEFFWFSNK